MCSAAPGSPARVGRGLSPFLEPECSRRGHWACRELLGMPVGRWAGSDVAALLLAAGRRRQARRRQPFKAGCRPPPAGPPEASFSRRLWRCGSSRGLSSRGVGAFVTARRDGTGPRSPAGFRHAPSKIDGCGWCTLVAARDGSGCSCRRPCGYAPPGSARRRPKARGAPVARRARSPLSPPFFDLVALDLVVIVAVALSAVLQLGRSGVPRKWCGRRASPAACPCPCSVSGAGAGREATAVGRPWAPRCAPLRGAP